MKIRTSRALLSVEEGRAEQAVELYALASRYPFVASSRWLEDVIGRQIAAAATLSADAAKAACDRGQARDLDAMIAELLADSVATITGSPGQSMSSPEATSCVQV